MISLHLVITLSLLMTPHPIVGRMTASSKMTPSLVLERVTPNPRITRREPLRWVVVNAAWEWAIPGSMMTLRLIAALGKEDRISALETVSATLGRVTVGVDSARVAARPIPVTTLRSTAALARVDWGPDLTSKTASAALGRVIVGAELSWVAPPSSKITPRPSVAMREAASTTVEWVMVGAASGTMALNSRETQSANVTFGWVMAHVALASTMASEHQEKPPVLISDNFDNFRNLLPFSAYYLLFGLVFSAIISN